MPAIISVVGRKNSGKTTLIERLIPALARRGFRVGALKHHHVGDFEPDTPGKDSWRHARAGALLTGVVAPRHVALFLRDPAPPGPAELVDAFGDRVDLVLAEGFFAAGFPKVEVARVANGEAPRATPAEGLIALVTDGPWTAEVPRFGLDDVEPLADFLAARVRAAR